MAKESSKNADLRQMTLNQGHNYEVDENAYLFSTTILKSDTDHVL